MSVFLFEEGAPSTDGRFAGRNAGLRGAKLEILGRRGDCSVMD